MTNLDAALAYAARGWPVFPLRPKGKEPLTEHGLKDATTDRAQINEWWSHNPKANVALVTGVAFDVLDLDGPEAVERFRTFCADNGIDPATIRKQVSKTAKGWHYLFKPSGIGNRARMLGAPIDWRGAGGYIVAPPSIHPSGVPYRWTVSSGTELPAVPEPLMQVLNPTTKIPLTPTLPKTTFGEGEHEAYFRKAFGDELDRVKAAQQGERNVVLFNSLCNVIELVNSGLDATAVDDVCSAGLSIGLDSREVERTLQSAYAKAGSNARELPAPATRAPERAVIRAESRAVAPKPAPEGVAPAPAPQALKPAPAVFQGVVGEAVLKLTEWSEADPVGVLASLLAGAGCAMGRSPHALVSTTKHPLLVWPLLLGRTSTGRKGTAHDLAEALLKVADQPFMASNITGGLSSGEGLIHAVRDPVFEHTHDPSKEPKLLDPGVDDKRRWVVETEFGSVMARAKREGNTLSAVLRQAWDGKTLSVLTKSSVIASGPHIAISAHVTPREFLHRLRDSDLAGGTYNRFLPLLVQRSQSLPEAPSPPTELLEAYGWTLQQRIRDARKVRWVPRTEQATKLWHDLYHELSEVEESEADNDRLGQFIARSVPYCLRLSVLYALLDGEQHVDERHLEAAAALVRYSIGSVRELLRSPEDPKLGKLIAALNEAEGNGLTRTQVSGLFNRSLTAPELDELLELVPGLEVHRVAQDGRGRPTIKYVIPTANETKELAP